MQASADIAISETTSTALGGLIGAAANEVDALSEVAGRLHSVIVRHVSVADAHEQSIEDAQMIDYLTQHLEALALFLSRLSEATPKTVVVDAESARAGVALADLARRLMGEVPSGLEATPRPAGDCELF
jgi:hypothetical protein